MKLIRTAAAAAGIVSAAAIALASPAAAAQPAAVDGWDHIWYTTDSAHGGTLFVNEHGDDVIVCDTARDGMSVRALLTWGTEGEKLTTSGGYGNCVEARATYGEDIPEHTTVYVSLWLGKNYAYEKDTWFVNDH